MERFTPRQVEILRLLASGTGYKQAACKLGIAMCTMRTHCDNITKRAGMSGTRAVVLAAIKEGIISRQDLPSLGAVHH